MASNFYMRGKLNTWRTREGEISPSVDDLRKNRDCTKRRDCPRIFDRLPVPREKPGLYQATVGRRDCPRVFKEQTVCAKEHATSAKEQTACAKEQKTCAKAQTACAREQTTCAKGRTTCYTLYGARAIAVMAR